MSVSGHPPGWWMASDGNHYPPESHPNAVQSTDDQFDVYVAPNPKTNRMAISSLVCSCLAVVLIGGMLLLATTFHSILLPPILGMMGLLFGFIARSQIKRSRGRQAGRSLSLAGIITGFAVIIICILVVVFVLLAFALCDHSGCGYNGPL